MMVALFCRWDLPHKEIQLLKEEPGKDMKDGVLQVPDAMFSAGVFYDDVSKLSQHVSADFELKQNLGGDLN